VHDEALEVEDNAKIGNVVVSDTRLYAKNGTTNEWPDPLPCGCGVTFIQAAREDGELGFFTRDVRELSLRTGDISYENIVSNILRVGVKRGFREFSCGVFHETNRYREAGQFVPLGYHCEFVMARMILLKPVVKSKSIFSR